MLFQTSGLNTFMRLLQESEDSKKDDSTGKTLMKKSSKKLKHKIRETKEDENVDQGVSESGVENKALPPKKYVDDDSDDDNYDVPKKSSLVKSEEEVDRRDDDIPDETSSKTPIVVTLPASVLSVESTSVTIQVNVTNVSHIWCQAMKPPVSLPPSMLMESGNTLTIDEGDGE